MPLSPLTNSEDTRLISVICSKQLIRDWKQQLKIDISDELLGYKEIRLYQCNQTKLLFFEPSAAAGSENLYKKLQQYDWFYMPHRWEHKIALDDLSGCHDVLEVGCAFGAFVDTGLKAGFNIKGIELNQAAVEVAHKQDLPVTAISLKEFSDAHPSSLDALCSFQVLEHVPNPREFLHWSIQSLRVGGKLIFCVPNADSFLKHQYNLLDMPPHHILRWSEVSFRSLEDLFPIKLERIVREPLATYHVSGYLNAYSQHFKKQNSLNSLLFNRYTLIFYERILQLGLRRYLMGQSLYVQFRKLP